MGKGKGTFEYWACRAPIGKVIFEVGGGGIAEQVAKDGEPRSSSVKAIKHKSDICLSVQRSN